MKRISEEQAIELLKKYSTNDKLFEVILNHCRAVQKVALRIAKNIANVDIEFIKAAAMLHDIGRFKTEDSTQHGVEGAKILRQEGLEDYALVAENHLGAGISKKDIIKQGLNLPLKDFLPITKEEKIITHADNLIEGEEEIDLDKAVERFKRGLGEEVANKIRVLGKEIEEMQHTKDL